MTAASRFRLRLACAALCGGGLLAGAWWQQNGAIVGVSPSAALEGPVHDVPAPVAALEGVKVPAAEPAPHELAAPTAEQGLAVAERSPPAPSPEPVPAAEVPARAADPLNPSASAETAWLLAEGPRRAAGSGRKVVALTFDDGPSLHTTPAILRALDKYRFKATFFAIAEYLEGERPFNERLREVAREVVARGHTLGSHSLQHQPLNAMSKAEARRHIERAHQLIEETTGVAPQFFRPPYGATNAHVSGVLSELGYTMVLWSVESQDMVRRDEDAMFEDLRRQLEYAGGGVVLMHDVRSSSLRVTARLLEYLDRRRFDPERPEKSGFDVVDMASFQRELSAAPQPFRTRTELAKARMASWQKRHASRSAQ